MYKNFMRTFWGIDNNLQNEKNDKEELPLIDNESKASAFNITQFAIYLIGLSDGLIHLASLAIYYLFKDYFRLTPYQISLIFMFPYIPAILKPFIALITDSVKIFGMRRKPYLFLFSLLQSLNFLALAFLNLNLTQAIIILFLISLSASFCTTIAEALVVESSIGKSYTQGTNQVTSLIGARAIGSLSVAYLSGSLLEVMSREKIFLLTSIFPLIILLSSFFIKESEYFSKQTIYEKFIELIQFMKNPIFLGPFLYIFIYMAGPDYDDVFFYYCTNKLGFSPTFMGTLRFTYGIASLIGIILYRYKLNKCSLKKTLILSTLVSFPIYISPIIVTEDINTYFGISNEIFILSGGFLIEAISEFQLLPLFILTANMCHSGLEASVFSFILTIKNIGLLTRKGSSSVLTYLLKIDSYNFDNLTLCIFICGLCLLLSLLVIPLLPNEKQIDEVKNNNNNNLIE